MLRYRSADRVVPYVPAVQGFEDDEEIDVTVGAGVAAGVAAEKISGHGLLTGYVRESIVDQETLRAFQLAIRFEALPLAAPASFGCVSARRPTVLLLTSQPTADRFAPRRAVSERRIPVHGSSCCITSRGE